MRSRNCQILAALAPMALAACASNPAPASERGWVGGRFADVARKRLSPLTSGHRDVVAGMPESAAGDAGALVTGVDPGTPLANAGLAPGDLVLSIDGAPVGDGFALREHVESMSPGAHAAVAYWRDGQTHAADVAVGRETYRTSGTVTVGLALSGTLDLWPFDDGVDLFHLLRLRWDRDRNDVTGPVADYRRKVRPGEPVEGPMQEATDAFLLIVGVARGKSVVSQETLP